MTTPQIDVSIVKNRKNAVESYSHEKRLIHFQFTAYFIFSNLLLIVLRTIPNIFITLMIIDALSLFLQFLWKLPHLYFIQWTFHLLPFLFILNDSLNENDLLLLTKQTCLVVLITFFIGFLMREDFDVEEISIIPYKFSMFFYVETYMLINFLMCRIVYFLVVIGSRIKSG